MEYPGPEAPWPVATQGRSRCPGGEMGTLLCPILTLRKPGANAAVSELCHGEAIFSAGIPVKSSPVTTISNPESTPKNHFSAMDCTEEYLRRSRNFR